MPLFPKKVKPGQKFYLKDGDYSCIKGEFTMQPESREVQLLRDGSPAVEPRMIFTHTDGSEWIEIPAEPLTEGRAFCLMRLPYMTFEQAFEVFSSSRAADCFIGALSLFYHDYTRQFYDAVLELSKAPKSVKGALKANLKLFFKRHLPHYAKDAQGGRKNDAQSIALIGAPSGAEATTENAEESRFQNPAEAGLQSGEELQVSQDAAKADSEKNASESAAAASEQSAVTAAPAADKPSQFFLFFPVARAFGVKYRQD